MTIPATITISTIGAKFSALNIWVAADSNVVFAIPVSAGAFASTLPTMMIMSISAIATEPSPIIAANAPCPARFLLMVANFSSRNCFIVKLGDTKQVYNSHRTRI